MAATIHQGTWTTLDQAYAAFGNWIEQNGYQTAGPCREIYLQEDGDPDTHVTEIQFPITRA